MTTFPDVPSAPGVPPVPRPSGPHDIPSPPPLLTNDAPGVLGANVVPQWGLFKNGTLSSIIDVDSVVEVEFKHDWAIADYPVEQGGFESYDKVQIPFDARVRLTRGGNDAQRQIFLNTLEAIGNSLALYDVVTPEKTYSSVSIAHYNYKRTSTNGVKLILADLWLQEIRTTGGAAFTQLGGNNVNANLEPSARVEPTFKPPTIKSPSAASPINGGVVQATTPEQAQQAIITGLTFGGNVP